ncbi:MerR family transcriptional regulator [Mycobacterium sp. C3-094]
MGAQVSIGDFSLMTSLSRKALRHYHDLGILEPTHIDPHTGYRFYDTSQVDHAHIIRRFRSLGMSIPDIKALLSTDDAMARTEIITTHLEQMEQQLQQTRETVSALRELLAPVDVSAAVEVRQEPALAVWSVSAVIDIDDIDTWFGGTLSRLGDALSTATGGRDAAFYGGLYERTLFSESHGEATLFVPAPNSASAPRGVRGHVLPRADYAVLTHTGDHEGIDRTYAALGTYANERLISGQGPTREHYLGGSLSEPTSFAATEIYWPIFRTTVE